MSDTFAYACADEEVLDIAHLPLVARMVKEFGWDGLVTFVAQQRQCDPLEKLCTPNFRAAQDWLRQVNCTD